MEVEFAFIAAAIWGFIVYKVLSSNILSVLKLANLFNNSQPSQAHHVCGDVYSVEYLTEGRSYRIFFPVLEKTKEEFNKKEVYLNIDDITINIDQQPGVPYLVVPNHFDKTAKISIVGDDDSCSEISGEFNIRNIS